MKLLLILAFFGDNVLLAPNILVEMNSTVGLQAYIDCQNTRPSGITEEQYYEHCLSVKTFAMVEDATARYQLLFNDLAAGRIRSVNTLNTYLAKYYISLWPTGTSPSVLLPRPKRKKFLKVF